ncbi:MAG TPA: TonB-dependent receptor [Cytophagales bacterium]|nr:TonB-dependent receptor [Cytophagales bacterium]
MRKSIPFFGSFFLVLSLWVIPKKTYSQSLSSVSYASSWTEAERFNKQEKLILLKSVLKSIEQSHNVFINYDDKAIENKFIDPNKLDLSGEDVGQILDRILLPLSMESEKIDDKIYLISKKRSLSPKQTGHNQSGVLSTEHFASLNRINSNIFSKVNIEISGVVKNEEGEGLPGVNVVVKGTTNGTVTDVNGEYNLNVADDASILVFSFIGYNTEEVAINNRTTIDVTLLLSLESLSEVIVTGYTAQKRETISSSISTVKSRDLERVHGGSTVSSALAGKLSGVSFRMAEGRPGASANIQIRNMGDPLYVIDGIQQDAGQFNNIAPNDIESITVLKDASAAIYGVRAANGVVVVTTKRGKLGSGNTINIDANYGMQNWTRFPETVNSYQWQLGKVEADMNRVNPETNMTPEELEKWKAGTEYGYRDFDWYDFIVKKNAPLTNFNVNATGGSDKINYYLSLSRLDQSSVLGREFIFNRTNLQSNIEARISKRLKVGTQINGRIEERDNPGVPGGDDYWAPRFALLRNLPWERPFANDNPDYLNDIGHNAENWGLLNKKTSGYSTDTWRVLQTNFNAEYEIPGIKGLTLMGKYSYYLADRILNGHEYTYDAYTYNPADDTYIRTGGSTNPWRERRNEKIFNKVYQAQLNYARSFGRHNIAATLVNERIERRRLYTMQHAVPTNNYLPNLTFSTMDDLAFADLDENEARIGYVGRLAYSFADKYFLELSGRRDASWKFAPDKRVGVFPSASAGWRISQEEFFQNFIGNRGLISELKIRASYGQMGDDNVNMGINGDDSRFLDPFAYRSGYDYNTNRTGKSVFDGNIVLGARDRGVPITNISWFTSTMFDVGLDYEILNNKVAGSFDYFYRKRTGLRGRKYDVLIPDEIGYALPEENVESDAVIGFEGSISYTGRVREVTFSIGGNASFARNRFLESYKPQYGNSLDQYFKGREDRWSNIMWGYEVIGQFQSQDEINNYPVNIDGQGNRTLLPGDLIYKDQNGDGVISTVWASDANNFNPDLRPIGYSPGRNPIVNAGLNISAEWKGFSLAADFSAGSMYTFQQRWELLWPYQNGGNLLAMYQDRWHREDAFNPDSEWISGKYPALRFNDPNHSNYRWGDIPSSFWTRNVWYIRARTIEIGYTVQSKLLEKVKIKKFRVYANTFNLFSIDNVKDLGIEPEIIEPNGLQYPQNKVVNFGINVSL